MAPEDAAREPVTTTAARPRLRAPSTAGPIDAGWGNWHKITRGDGMRVKIAVSGGPFRPGQEL